MGDPKRRSPVKDKLTASIIMFLLPSILFAIVFTPIAYLYRSALAAWRTADDFVLKTWGPDK
jgi:hypothetical protein